jgi:hypothetical protein
MSKVIDEAPEADTAPEQTPEPRWNAYEAQAEAQAHEAMRLAAEAADRMTVFQRVAAIVAEMPAIGKGQRNEQQGFMYRGHDDVMNALNPLLSHYGVFFTPRVIERITDQRATNRGGVMYEVNLHVEYTFYGPNGDSFTADAWGEGTDSGDKSTNKAMTMALKNVLAQTFAVSTEEISRLDTDQHSDEPTVGRRSAQPAKPTTSDGIELREGAPLGWSAISAALKQIDESMPWADWVREALTLMTGEGKLSDLSDDEKRDTGIRVGNGVAYLIETIDGREMPPPTRAEVQDAFARQDAVGVVLSGPDTPLDPDEHAAAAQAELDAQATAAAEADTPEAPEAAESDSAVEEAPEQPEAPATQESGSTQRRSDPAGDRDNEGGDAGLLGQAPTSDAGIDGPGEAPA